MYPYLFFHRFPQLPVLYDDMMLAKVKYNLEQRYKEFFDEVSGEGSHDWKLFYSKENGEYVWTERTCGIFGNLATIYRQRGWYAACDEVMVYYTYVIQNFEAMIRMRLIARKSDNDELVHCRQLVMKYHRVAANLGANLKRTANMPVSYRFLIGYEIDMGIANTEADEYAWMMEGFLKRPCTKANLAKTTDAELVFMAQMMYKHMPYTNEELQLQEQATRKAEFERDHPGERFGGSVVLSKCAGCSSTEPFLGTYKQCARCRTVKYCGRVSTSICIFLIGFLPFNILTIVTLC